MVAQSFDGAATTAGIKTGVAKRFNEVIPQPVFVHKLNLALQDATKQISYVSDIMLIVQNVSVFVGRSAKRHALFEHLQGDEKKQFLQTFCATRWSSRYLAIKSFVKLYKYLLTFLEIVGADADPVTASSARGYSKQVKNFHFIFYCNVLLLLFEKTHILSKFLQLLNNNVVQALELCHVTIMDLTEMKNNYAEIYEVAKKICEEEEIEINICLNSNQNNTRKRARINENNSSIDQHKESFEKIIEVYISALNTRFPKNELKCVIAIYNLLMLSDEKANSVSYYTEILKYKKFINLE